VPFKDELKFGVRASRELVASALATRRQAQRHSPHPPTDGLVLDVGGGHSSHPRADVVVEKYVANDFERSTAHDLDLSKPLVVADGQALPFRGNAFAYVIASHVLEHATDPRAFAAELSRVAPAGFVQLPSRQAELTFGWAFHPWLIDREGDVLVFHPRQEARAPIGQVFHHAMEDSALFSLWFGAQRDRWHHSIEWRGRLSVRVEGESAAEQTAEFDLAQTTATLTALHDRGRIRPLPPVLWDALRCPSDHGELRFAGDRLACDVCERSFPVVGQVPILLAEAAQTPSVHGSAPPALRSA
jgi:uncharacterized protein YbaR (Trm112 family)